MNASSSVFITTDIIKSLALFYLIILTPYLSGIFTCFQKKQLEQNKAIPFILGFFLFYFLVILMSDNTNIKFAPPLQKFFYTFIYYVLFLLTTRIANRILVIILILLFLTYFIEINRQYYLHTETNKLKQNEKEVYLSHQYWITLDWPIKIRLFKVEPQQFNTVDKIEPIIFIIVVMLVVFGLIAYIGELKDTDKNNNINWKYLFDNVEICKVQHNKPLFYYFKKGLGLG
jgi:hypothetical protein